MIERTRKWLWKGRVKPYLLLLVFGLLVWSEAVFPGDVDLDTPWLVFNNPILSEGSPSALPTILFDMSPGTRLTLGAEYLPVRDLTVLVDFAVFGRQWTSHHIQNIAWYLGAGLVFLSFLCRLLGPGLRAFFGAALFLVLPVHVESVAWLASRKDVVSLFLVLLAIRLFLDRTEHAWKGLLALLLLLPAYWAKNTAIVLPAWLLVHAFVRERPRDTRWWLGWLPWVALSAAGLLVTLSLGSVVAMYAEPRTNSVFEALSLQASVLWRYTGMLLWPTRLAVFYVEPTVGWGVEALLGGAVAASLVLVAILSREPLVKVGLAWFFIALLPVSQLIPIQNLMADRYLLLPSAGIVLALTAGLPSGFRGYSLRGLWLVVGLIGIGLQVGILRERCGVWHNSQALWLDETEKQPLHPRGWTALAGSLSERGHPEEAVAVLNEGLLVLPDHPLLLASLAGLKMELGEPEAAERLYKAALRGDPKLRKAANNLAVLLRRQGRSEEAAAVATILVRQYPLYAEGWNTLGAILLDLRQFPEAEQALGRASLLAPFDASVTLNLAALAWLQGNRVEAARWWTETLRLDPANTVATEGLRRAAAP